MRCLQCGKEIPEGRNFCSSSCSANYNNVRRQIKTWTNYMYRCAKSLGVEVQDVPETLRTFYWSRNYSVFEFWYKFQIPFWILQKIFKANAIPFRDSVESQKIALEEGRKTLQADQIHYKTGHHVSWEGLEFFYRSSYELEYAKQLDEQKIPYRVENLRKSCSSGFLSTRNK